MQWDHATWWKTIAFELLGLYTAWYTFVVVKHNSIFFMVIYDTCTCVCTFIFLWQIFFVVRDDLLHILRVKLIAMDIISFSCLCFNLSIFHEEKSLIPDIFISFSNQYFLFWKIITKVVVLNVIHCPLLITNRSCPFWPLPVLDLHLGYFWNNQIGF